MVLIFPLHHCPKSGFEDMSLPGQVPNLWFGKTSRDVTNIKLTERVKRGFGTEISISEQSDPVADIPAHCERVGLDDL